MKVSGIEATVDSVTTTGFDIVLLNYRATDRSSLARDVQWIAMG